VIRGRLVSTVHPVTSRDILVIIRRAHPMVRDSIVSIAHPMVRDTLVSTVRALTVIRGSLVGTEIRPNLVAIGVSTKPSRLLTSTIIIVQISSNPKLVTSTIRDTLVSTGVSTNPRMVISTISIMRVVVVTQDKRQIRSSRGKGGINLLLRGYLSSIKAVHSQIMTVLVIIMTALIITMTAQLTIVAGEISIVTEEITTILTGEITVITAIITVITV